MLIFKKCIPPRSKIGGQEVKSGQLNFAPFKIQFSVHLKLVIGDMMGVTQKFASFKA